MGRKAKIRDTYTDDIVTLSRIRDAVVNDNRRPDEWKKEAIASLENAIAKLATAPLPDGE